MGTKSTAVQSQGSWRLYLESAPRLGCSIAARARAFDTFVKLAEAFDVKVTALLREDYEGRGEKEGWIGRHRVRTRSRFSPAMVR